MGILGGIQRRIRHTSMKRTYSLRGESKQKHMRMQMARLTLNNGSSATEEHHQTGHVPVPSEWKNNKCYRSSEQGKKFSFPGWSEKRQRIQGGRTLGPALDRMGDISIAGRKRGG